MKIVRYKPEFCDLIIELGKQGKPKAVWAAKIGVSKSTLANWENAIEPFAMASDLAKTYFEAYWFELNHANSMNPDTTFAQVSLGKFILIAGCGWSEKKPPTEILPSHIDAIEDKSSVEIEWVKSKPE